VQKRGAITCRETEYLSAAMNSRMAVDVHCAEMRNDNATERTIVNRGAGCIDDFNENAHLKDVEITGRLSAGNRKHAELRRTVEIANGLHTVLPHRHDGRGVEGPARTHSPTHAMTFEPGSISFACAKVGKNPFWMMAAAVDGSPPNRRSTSLQRGPVRWPWP
jgi:hypothetical protein